MRQMVPQNYNMANMASPMRNPYDQKRSQYNFMSPQNYGRGCVDMRQIRSPQIPPSKGEDGRNGGKENVFKAAPSSNNNEWKRMERNSTGNVVDNSLMFQKYREMMMSPQPVSKSKCQSAQMQFRSPQFNSKSQNKLSQYQTLQSPQPNSRANILKGHNGQINKPKENNLQGAENTKNSNSNNIFQSPNIIQNHQNQQLRNERKTYNTGKSGYPGVSAINRHPKMSVDNQENENTSKYLKYKEQCQNKNQNIPQNNKSSAYMNQVQGDIQQRQDRVRSPGYNQYYQQNQKSQLRQGNQNQMYQAQYHNQNSVKNSSHVAKQYQNQKVGNYEAQVSRSNNQVFSQSLNNDKWERQRAMHLQNQRSPQPHINSQKLQDNLQKQKINEEYLRQRKLVAEAQKSLENLNGVGSQVIKGKGFNQSQRPNFKSSKAKIDAMFQKAIERSQALTSKLEATKGQTKVNPEVASQVKESVKKIVETVNTKITKVESKEKISSIPESQNESKMEDSVAKKSDISPYNQKPQNGRRVYKYENGEVYEGEWVNGKREGFGILKSPNSINIYSGDWQNDYYHGQGVLKNDKVESTTEPFDYKDLNKIGSKWTIFEGEFKEGFKEGLGTLTFSNGEKFNGKFCNDVVDGEGTFQTLEGDFILGNWVNNVLEKTL